MTSINVPEGMSELTDWTIRSVDAAMVKAWRWRSTAVSSGRSRGRRESRWTGRRSRRRPRRSG